MPEASECCVDQVPFQARLENEPWTLDWFNTMRWFEARNPHRPRLGEAVHAADEVVRVSQAPSMQFAASTLAEFDYDHRHRPRLTQLAFGLFGPNGPLPLHLTELVRSAEEVDGNEALRGFVDIFQHRAALLFYRAWSETQAVTSLDRPGDDQFGTYVGSLAGYGEAAALKRDSIPAHALYHVSGQLVRLTRNPEGLRAILEGYFERPFRIEEWVMSWLEVSPEDRTALGGRLPASQLGVGAICGIAVPDRQHRFRVHAGPLDLAAYERFLPGGAWHVCIRDWVRHYCGYELAWDLRLVLRADEVPPLQLGGRSRLGWTSWLGSASPTADRGDLVLDCDRVSLG